MSSSEPKTPNDLTESRQKSEELLPLVYDELRRLAARRLSQEQRTQSLTATSLVHEVYLRLADGDQPPRWNDRWHFFAVAAEAMRRVLVDNARRNRSVKHGGGMQRCDFDAVEVAWCGPSDDILAIEEALCTLEATSPRKAELVKLRFFAGLTMEEAAEALGISRNGTKRLGVCSLLASR